MKGGRCLHHAVRGPSAVDVETATARPTGPVSCTIEARGIQVIQDKPTSLGGTDDGMMASELLLASLLACQLSTFHKVAAKRGRNVRALRLHGELHFNEASDIHQVRLEWTLSADDDAKTLLRLTDRVCTISRALNVPVDWTYSVEASTSSK